MDRGLWVLYLAFGVLEWAERQPEKAELVVVESSLLRVPAPNSSGAFHGRRTVA